MVPVGAIVRWRTLHTRPPKHKRFLCVVPDLGWFFMLNTRDLWGASVELPAADAGGGLDHDSFAELGGLIELPAADLAAMLDDGRARRLGAVGRATLRRVRAAVEQADTLSEADRAIVLAALESALVGPA